MAERNLFTQIKGPFVKDQNILNQDFERRLISRLGVNLAKAAPLEWLAKGHKVIMTIRDDSKESTFIIGHTGMLELKNIGLRNVNHISFNTNLTENAFVDLWLKIEHGTQKPE